MGATRQRGDFAGSPPETQLGDGSDFRQGGVAKALWCSSAAAEFAGLDRVALYRLRQRNPSFARAWAEAAEFGAAGLEDEAIRRAAEGWLDPVFYQGAQCGSVRKYSDSLLMFLLKARLPEKFKERRDVAHTGELTVRELLAQIESKTGTLPSQDR